MDIFKETDYRLIIETLIRQMPKFGHGQMSRLALFLKVNTTLVSQVLSKKRDFTEDQALMVTQFFHFNQTESYYFLMLVHWSRAATSALKQFYMNQILRLQKESLQSVQNRASAKAELSFEQQAVYYSSWIYAAIHTVVSIEGCQDVSSIAKRLHLQIPQAQEFIDRLIEYRLIIEKGGRLQTGLGSTYLSAKSPLVVRHHQSWRQISNFQMEKWSAQNFFFTAPFSISKEDYEVFRKEVVDLVGRLYKVVDKTKPQELACLNIDFFKF